MRKILILLICIFFVSSSAASASGYSNKFKLGVYQYKTGNYVGCMQTMQDLTMMDPGNAMAHYYLGMAYTQAGMKKEAIKEYKSVINLNKNSALSPYAQKGLALLGVKEDLGTKGKTLGAPLKSNSSTHSAPPNQLPAPPTIDIPNQLRNPAEQQKFNSMINQANPRKVEATPSQEEVTKALATLQQAGMGNNMYSNPEMMQMNMLMSSMGGGMNNGYNSSNSMLPLLMMSQNNGQKMDPQLMQTMLTNMMSPGMFSSGNNNDSGW